MSRTQGGLMVIKNPNHVDLDLHCPIGWLNSQTHILHIQLHHHLSAVQLFQFLSRLLWTKSCHTIKHELYIMYIF